ncbi:hypothetical protein [Candidatus Palauibacter sp.]|uniref:hypothetical protein n=1 Tax=Candidatus Palauibacter sp. TaxID=3101350 RepID=UPI003B599758
MNRFLAAELIQVLLGAGADPNARDDSGLSPCEITRTVDETTRAHAVSVGLCP